MIANMKAELLHSFKRTFTDGALVEMKVWRVPAPVPGSNHPYRYRLFYGYPGQRVVGYDNERGKGDHRHIEGHEEPYVFVSVERLLEDFIRDVEIRRIEP
jgi:hypothetical protein